MAMGKKRGGQPDLWLAATDLPQSPGHPFYEKLNEILRDCGFDRFCGERCAEYYAEGGRPSIPPGTYFRLLLVGFFEGIGSERGICWRCSDSLSLRSFLGLSPTDAVPNHSSLCRIRQRLPVDVYREVFEWVLERLGELQLCRTSEIALEARHTNGIPPLRGSSGGPRSRFAPSSGLWACCRVGGFLNGLLWHLVAAVQLREDLANHRAVGLWQSAKQS